MTNANVLKAPIGLSQLDAIEPSCFCRLTQADGRVYVFDKRVVLQCVLSVGCSIGCSVLHGGALFR